MDFRRTLSQRSVRYADMIVPARLRDGAESAYWESQTLVDTAPTGDPRASTWMVYCAGGIAIHQFDLSPPSAEIRTLNDGYRLAAHVCAADPVGSSQTHSVPNSAGKAAVIATEWGEYIQHSHTPLVTVESLHRASIDWETFLSTGAQTAPRREGGDFGRTYRIGGRRNYHGRMRSDGAPALPGRDGPSHFACCAEPLRG